MSGAQRTLLIWVAVILLAAYLMNINVAAEISSIIHAAQYIHQSNSH